jgi:hypothetical protein
MPSWNYKRDFNNIGVRSFIPTGAPLSLCTAAIFFSHILGLRRFANRVCCPPLFAVCLSPAVESCERQASLDAEPAGVKARSRMSAVATKLPRQPTRRMSVIEGKVDIAWNCRDVH